jgi:hypothetical protein
MDCLLYFLELNGRAEALFAETNMNRVALILTVAAYLLSLGFYVRFLNTGRELIGRLERCS